MDERIWPLYRKAAELGGCIVIHTGYGPVLQNRLKWQHPYEHEDLLEELSDTPISFGHCGFHHYQDAMLMMTRHRKLYADFAWWHVFPIDYIARAFVFAKSIDVFDRLMFGTDFPHTNIAEVMKIYQRIPEYTLQHGLEPLITEDDLKSFFYENAENFVRSRNAT
jgi:predicted TIM-barrel fold metal-dependent hydrolase